MLTLNKRLKSNKELSPQMNAHLAKVEIPAAVHAPMLLMMKMVRMVMTTMIW